MTNKNKTRDMGAFKNGMLISALSACIMLGAVGTYRLTSADKSPRKASQSEPLESDQDTVSDDTGNDTVNTMETPKKQ